jgi:Putative methyltransferase
MRDYLAWHDDYDRPGSPLHLRLLVVQDLIAAALDEGPPGAIRVISMCAGQGRDLVTVARRHRRGPDLIGRLVEIDRRNVDAARAAIAETGIAELEVVEGDAGHSDSYMGATPAHLVLACGVFGNVADADVKTTVEFMPALCAPGAWVIWTRVPRDDGIVDRIQDWFKDVGFEPRALVIGAGNLFGVGAVQFHGQPAEAHAGVRLFDFFR